MLYGTTQTLQAQEKNKQFRTVNRTLCVDQATGNIRLNEAEGVGIAWIVAEEFTDGVVEFDVKGVDKFQGSFLGLAFHGSNDKTYDAIYFRPFNFKAPDSLRKSHALQYMSNPDFDWPLLRERFPGQYEKGMPSNIDPNEWFHVKLVLSSETLAVYVNRHKEPVFETKLLGNGNGKMIGYWVGNGSGGEWKNLKLSTADR